MPELAPMLLAAALAGDPLQGLAGDAARGAQVAASRSTGLCVLCHALPGVPAVQAGTIGPDLAGVGARNTPAQLRERLVAPERFNPQTLMPSATRSTGLQRVAAARQGQGGVLTPQQLEDVLAWLETLR